MALIQEGFVPLVEDVPGFIWYVTGVNPETRGQFSVGVFADEAGAAESTRRAEEWGDLGAGDFVEDDLAVYEGVIGVAAEASEGAGELIGKYVVIRLRQPNPDWPVAEVMTLIGEGYVPLAREIPGFVAYFGSEDSESGDQAYVGVFDDQTGDPTVAEGVIGAAAM
jgi:hypothetical protein